MAKQTAAQKKGAAAKPATAKAKTTRTESQTAAAKAKASDDATTIATVEENARLEHSVGGSTTRDDLLDAGVTMLPGSPKEPTGPEDALGEGAKRGDYRDRVEGNPHESRLVEGGGQPVYRKDADGNDVVVDYTPRSELVSQRPRAEDIGDVEGKKGGVDTVRDAA